MWAPTLETDRRRGKPRAGTLRRLLAIVVAAAAVLLAPLAAFAEDLRWESEITYSAQFDQGLLHVSAEMTFTNLMPNSRSGNVITSYYYDAVSFYVPDAAENVVATYGGKELTVNLGDPDDPEAEDVMLAEVRFGRRLTYKKSMTVVFQYDIPGDAPRTESVFRVNPSYVSFGAYGWGDPGQVTVNVVLPRGFTAEFGDVHHTFSLEQDQTTYRFKDIEDPTEFFVWVQAWNEAAMTNTASELEQFDILVKSWPDDPEWGVDVLEAVNAGLPHLQDLVGLEWEPTRTLDIIESQSVTLAGYGGWYLDLQKDIEIGEWVDPHLVLHELSHTWFNDDLFAERWITEGLADEFAAEATELAGLESDDYERPTFAPPPYRPIYLLNDWVVPDSEKVFDVDRYEEYGYGTSFWVIQNLAEEIGHDSLSAVLYAADNDHFAYQQPGVTEMTAEEVDDWHRFLDLLQEIGGSERAPELFATFITAEDLTPRAEARELYASLRDTGWDIPFYVREPMEAWDFDVATKRIDEAAGIITTRDLISADAETLNVTAPESLEVAFETATETLHDVQELADAHLDTAHEVVAAKAAVDAQRTFFQKLGLVEDEPELMLGRAVSAFAAEDLSLASTESAAIMDVINTAEAEGQMRFGIASGAAILVTGTLTIWIWRRRRDKSGTDQAAQPGPLTGDPQEEHSLAE